jgi:hypothetical protein
VRACDGVTSPQLLREWINPTYLTEEAAMAVQARMGEYGSVQLMVRSGVLCCSCLVRAYTSFRISSTPSCTRRWSRHCARATSATGWVAAACRNMPLVSMRIGTSVMYLIGDCVVRALVGPPHMQRYLEMQTSATNATNTATTSATTSATTGANANDTDLNAEMSRVHALMSSPAFVRLLHVLVGRKLLG